jgi:RNA polymerase sigma-70 factor (ECF subfamily)
VREHKKGVFSVAYAKLRNAHDAEDVMQEVFIEAYRNFHKLRPGKIRAWLYKATVYRCKDHVRKAMRREKRELAFADLRLSNPSADAQIERERCDTVLAAIERLPEEHRIVIMLKHFARLSYADISKTTGLSTPTIGNRLQAARKSLREKLIEMSQGADRDGNL